jgi:hypothetical protein
MIRPSFQFYPADWRNNSNLRRCSEAARGAWLDILCVLHDSDEYGVCRWPLAELARSAGVPIKLARELVSKNVLKGDDKAAKDYSFAPKHAGKEGAPVTLVTAGDGPCWYSSRFVRDEYIRLRRGQSSRFSSENQPPKNGIGDGYDDSPNGTPKGGIGEALGDGPSSSSSSSIVNPQTPGAPNPADAGPSRPPRKAAIALQTFIDACRQSGERPLRDYTPLWTYTQAAGLSEDFVALAWAEFCRRFLPGGAQEAKRQKDWRATFRKYVENNYFKLWAIDRNDQYFLTSQGKQAEKFQEAKAAA